MGSRRTYQSTTATVAHASLVLGRMAQMVSVELAEPHRPHLRDLEDPVQLHADSEIHCAGRGDDRNTLESYWKP